VKAKKQSLAGGGKNLFCSGRRAKSKDIFRGKSYHKQIIYDPEEIICGGETAHSVRHYSLDGTTESSIITI